MPIPHRPYNTATGLIGNRLLAVSFVLLSYTVYFPILNSFFLSDDFGYLARKGRFLNTAGPGVEGHGFFRPATILTYNVEKYIFGLDPLGFHCISVVFHGLNSFLVYLLTEQLLSVAYGQRPSNATIAVTAGILFLVLPCHPESVTWISGQADVLACSFELGSLVYFFRFISGSGPFNLLAMSQLLFASALLYKETAIAEPVIVFVFSTVFYRFPGYSRPERFRYSAIFLAPLILYLVIRTWALHALVGGYGDAHTHFSLYELSNNLSQYIVAAVGIPPYELILTRVYIVKLLAILFLATAPLVYVLIPSHVKASSIIAILLFAALSFLSQSLVTLNLGLSLPDLQGARFVYLPSVFSCIFIACTADLLGRHVTAACSTLLVLALVYAVSLQQVNQRWKHAAGISRNLIDDVGASRPDTRIIVLNIPDSLLGSYIYRNGYQFALWLFRHVDSERVEIVSRVYLTAPDSWVQFTKDEERREYTLSGVSFLDDSLTSSPSVAMVRSTGTERRFRIEVPSADVYYYSQGHLHGVR